MHSDPGLFEELTSSCAILSQVFPKCTGLLSFSSDLDVKSVFNLGFLTITIMY